MLRLLLDPPAPGRWNMAVDEALLETAVVTQEATLRFYQWQEATLSLGYFQALADRQQHPPSANCPAVRRASGGGAILHDSELTYSIALPQGSRSSPAARLYEVCHQTLIAALAEFDVSAALYRDCSQQKTASQPATRPPFLCFQRRTCFDVVCGEAKIAGSAQRRRRGAVLQHGSILLAASPCAPELPGIQQVAGKKISTDDLARRWAPRLAEALHMRLIASALSPGELSRSEALAQSRFYAVNRLQRR